MRRRNRASARKEKTIMLLSSVFVLAALTVTGLFLKGRSDESNDGYVVDFSTIEDEANNQAKLDSSYIQETPMAKEADSITGPAQGAVTEDDLDYDPNFREANSPNVENDADKSGTGSENVNAGKKEETAGNQSVNEKANENEKKPEDKSAKLPEETEEGMIDETVDTEALRKMEDTEALATTIQPALNFTDKDSLAWPVVGNVLINYSMDKTIYFPTLQQYKYNPAIIISAAEGEMITAAANGKVLKVANDPELGTIVVMELGSGYEITYGQLKDITVSEGGYVSRGDIIGHVAAPTKYFVTEGSNVYFKLTKDGVPVDPMTKLK